MEPLGRSCGVQVGQNYQKISVHAVANPIAPRKCLTTWAAIHELTDTIPAVANEPELTILDSINIERLTRWTL